MVKSIVYANEGKRYAAKPGTLIHADGMIFNNSVNKATEEKQAAASITMKSVINTSFT